MNKILELPDLKAKIAEMSQCNTIDQWIKLSDGLIEVIRRYLALIQTDGLFVLTDQKSSLNSNKIDECIVIDEIFFPYTKNELNIACWLWIEKMTQFISSFKDNELISSYTIYSDGKEIKFLLSTEDQLERISQHLESFFPGINYRKVKNIETLNYKCWIGGIPSVIDEKSVRIPIDLFISSLYGQKFMFEIKFKSINYKKINELILILQDILDKFKILNELNVSTGTARGFQGVLNMNLVKQSGLYLIELLQTDIQRCFLGLQQGYWETQLCFSTDNKSLLQKGTSIISSIYGGYKSIPMQLQIKNQPFTTLLTSFEIANYYSFPTKEIPGISIKTIHEFGSNFKVSNTNKITLGKILYNMQLTDNDYSINLNSLTKHTLITGITGSGKTTTVKKILSELKNNNIPFLVIEPVKSEYKIPGVNYIDVGKDEFRINLFKPAVKETDTITHIDYLRAVFGASYVLYPPMPYILEASIYKVYSKYGFNFDSKDKLCKHYPTIKDLIFCIEEVIKESGYSERLRDDILASLKVRLQNLLKGFKGHIFDTEDIYPPFDKLMTQNTVINLNRIVDDEQKALMMSILLAYLYEYREASGVSTNLLHVTVVEEAHRLLAKAESSEGNPETANPKAKAVEFFANLLSEIRAYGEGLIIAEQIPDKLITDVIKNTSTKIVHKLVAYDDRDLIGKSMNFENGQENFLTILNPGQAIVFSDNTINPIVINIVKSK
jgi:hypothetical protein